jgi:hypothetical protein
MKKECSIKKHIEVLCDHLTIFKRILFFALIICLAFCVDHNTAYAADGICKVVYFYSTTCSECSETGAFFEQYADSNQVVIQKMNVYEEDNITLLDAYCKIYNVKKGEANNVPIVFVGNSYLFGSENIIVNFSSLLAKEDYTSPKSPEEVKKSDEYGNTDTKINLLKLCTSALVNSLNPCSFSMMLFLLLTLASRKSSHILRIGMAFCIGKIVTFFAIGTILFRSFAYIENTKLMRFVNVVLIIIYAALLLANLYDFINIVKKRKKDYVAQIPSSFRKFNHNLISKAGSSNSSLFVMSAVGVFVGALVASTEFLCSGQIYLMTIVNMIHSSDAQYTLVTSMGYMLLYSVICGIPLILLVFVVTKGKNAFELSMKFTEKIAYVKLLNIVFFAGFIIYTIFKG